MTDGFFAEHVRDRIVLLQEPLGLDRWNLQPVSEPLEDARATCAAQPEYREATITLDLDKLKTGDEIDEIAVHEMTHCHIGPIHDLAEHLATALAESAPEHLREPLRKLLLERVRHCGEQTTTDVGHVYLKLLRRAGILLTPVADGDPIR